MALTPRLVSGSSAKRPEPSGINAMLRVQQNSTGQLKRTSVSQKAWITGTSPVMTTVAVCQAPKGSGQLVEQRFRVFKVGCVEAFGEPSVDRREQVAGFGAAPLVAAEPGKARGGT